MKILIIKPSSFGDIIQANPALTALREYYPDAEIDWLVFEAWAQVPAMFPDIDKIIFWKRNGGVEEFLRIAKIINLEHYDLVIDLQGLFRTALLARISGAVKIIGAPGMKEFSSLLIKEVYPQKKGQNAVYRSLEIIKYLTGREPEAKFNVGVSQDSVRAAQTILEKNGFNGRDRLVGIIPSARGPAKAWPKEYFKKLINMSLLYSKDVSFVILGSENGLSDIKDAKVLDLSGKTSISELGAVLNRCSGVIGPDTGPLHLANALGVPVVAIFGGSDVTETAPVGEKAVVLTKGLPCSPCRTSPTCSDFKCLTLIKPEEVFNSIKDWLQ